MSKKNNVPHFFWDDANNKKSRSRFNLLLLEYGEYFLEDLSVYHFPMPTNDLSKVFEISDASKIQGRLKLSTRSIIFEPNDVRYPLLKFPYKSMSTALETFNLKQSELKQLSVTFSGFFTFMCLNYFEIKANDKIGPYKLIESQQGESGLKGHRMLFALVHSDLANVLVKIEQFRHILGVYERQGSAQAMQLLQPFIDTALLTSFDSSHLVDFHEKLLLATPIAVKKIKPLIINPGSLMLTNSRIYFQPSNMNNIADSILHFEISKILRIFKRRYLLRQVGLEVLLPDNTSHLFAFESSADRDFVFNVVIQQNNSLCRQPTLESVTRRWQAKEISNFEYLMYLNNEADRSGNDLTQYPVFPHVVADFTSKKLSLSNPRTFRDLSKPIGALNAERLRYFKDRYHSMPEADPASGLPPPFLYGTHYSTPGYVLFYLVRVAPEYMLCLQNGKFDSPDRMFHSIADTYESCLTNHADLKELIPEFFCGSGEFLVNYNNLDLGHRHTGERLCDVVLPPWAETPRDFIRKMSKALESDHVSNHLHEWIDLIFGYKQKGQAAVDADNLYYYLTYEGSVDVESISDPRERSALEVQIQEFGQTPKQLFTMPHVRRFDNSSGSTSSSASGGVKSAAASAGPGAGSLSLETPSGKAAKSAEISRKILDLLSDGDTSHPHKTKGLSSHSSSSGDMMQVQQPPAPPSAVPSPTNSAGASTPLSPSANLNNLNNSNYYLGMKMSSTITSPPAIELQSRSTSSGSASNTRAAYRSANSSELDRILAEADRDSDNEEGLGASSAASSVVNQIAILDLDEEFKQEVQRELMKQQQQQQRTMMMTSGGYSANNNNSYGSSGGDRPVSGSSSSGYGTTSSHYKAAAAPPPANAAGSYGSSNSSGNYNNSNSNANSGVGGFSYPSIAGVRKTTGPPAPSEEQQQQTSSVKNSNGNNTPTTSGGNTSSSGGGYRFTLLNKFLSKA